MTELTHNINLYKPTLDETANLDETAKRFDRLIIKQKCDLQEECSICLETMYQKKIIYLPCKHYFHYNCAMCVFNNKKYSCPLCRHDLISCLKKINYPFPVTRTYYAYGYDYTAGAGADAGAGAAAGAAADNLLFETLFSIFRETNDNIEEFPSLVSELIMFYYI